MAQPSPDFKFRSGKYQGMTYEWVSEKNPSYLAWVKENQPNMLKERVTTKKNLKEVPSGKLTPNPNFENEGPAWYCLPYLEKMSKESDEDEFNF